MIIDFFTKIADVIGLIGVSLILYAFFLLNTGRISSEAFRYQVLNFAGACLILYSLFFNWNLSSVVIEVAWILISLIGFYKIYNKNTNNQ